MQGQSVRPASGRWSTYLLLIVSIAAAAVFGVFNIANQLVGPASNERQRAVAVIQNESNQLTAYAGIQPDQVIIRNEPFVAPVLLSNYYLPGTCQDLQKDYTSVAPSLGWRIQGRLRIYHDPRYPNDASQDLLHSEYTKTVQSISLTMVIECYASNHGYSLDISHDKMETPMPNLFLVFGVAGAILLVALPLVGYLERRQRIRKQK